MTTEEMAKAYALAQVMYDAARSNLKRRQKARDQARKDYAKALSHDMRVDAA